MTKIEYLSFGYNEVITNEDNHMTPEFCNIAYLNQKEVGTIPDVIKKHCGISDRNVCVVGIPHKMIIEIGRASCRERVSNEV